MRLIRNKLDWHKYKFICPECSGELIVKKNGMFKKRMVFDLICNNCGLYEENYYPSIVTIDLDDCQADIDEYVRGERTEWKPQIMT